LHLSSAITSAEARRAAAANTSSRNHHNLLHIQEQHQSTAELLCLTSPPVFRLQGFVNETPGYATHQKKEQKKFNLQGNG